MKKKLLRYYDTKAVRKYRHCGLDPQSQNSEELTTMRFRVKHGMTKCACHCEVAEPRQNIRVCINSTCHCEGAKRPSQSHCNMPKAVTNGSHLTVHCSQKSTHPNPPSKGRGTHAPQEVKNRLTYSLNNLFTSQKPPTRKSKISTLPSREGISHTPQAVNDLTSYRLNDLTTFKKVAFTLAEVLITLAIIGIVAALTIPTLVQNYQKKQWVSGLQKGYATLSNAFKMAMAEDGVDNFNQTNLWLSVPPNINATDGIRNMRGSCDDSCEIYTRFAENLKKYMKIVKYCVPNNANQECFNTEYKSLNGDKFLINERLKVYTSDGMTYYFRMYDGRIYNNFWHENGIEIDVNGDKGPNQYGKDLFSFAMSGTGNIIIPGTKQWTNHDSDGGLYHWSDNSYYNACTKDNWGTYCGARIFENGWRMDY